MVITRPNPCGQSGHVMDTLPINYITYVGES